MTLRNRPLIERPGADNIEECIASPAGVEQTLHEGVMNAVGSVVSTVVATVVVS